MWKGSLLDPTASWVYASPFADTNASANTYHKFQATYTNLGSEAMSAVLSVIVDNVAPDVTANKVTIGAISDFSWEHGAMAVNVMLAVGDTTFEFTTYNEAGKDTPAGLVYSLAETDTKTVLMNSGPVPGEYKTEPRCVSSRFIHLPCCQLTRLACGSLDLNTTAPLRLVCLSTGGLARLPFATHLLIHNTHCCCGARVTV